MKLATKHAVPQFQPSIVLKNTTEVVVPWPCSEETIIQVHDQLLNNGLHYLLLPTLAAGRALLEPLVTSMQYFHESAVLTVEPGARDLGVIDLYGELVRSGHLMIGRDMEEFVLEYCRADFLWIEQSARLLSMPWYDEFEQKIADLHLDRHMPVAFISYDCA